MNCRYLTLPYLGRSNVKKELLYWILTLCGISFSHYLGRRLLLFLSPTTTITNMFHLLRSTFLSTISSPTLTPQQLLRPSRRRRRNNRTSPPVFHLSRLLSILIRNEQLASLSISSRFLSSNFDDGKSALPTMDFVEDFVHFFERAVGGFGEEKVYARHHEGVDDGEDGVRVVLDIGECHWRDHDDHEL